MCACVDNRSSHFPAQRPSARTEHVIVLSGSILMLRGRFLPTTVSLSLCLSICLSVCLSVCLSIYLSTAAFTIPAIYPHLSIVANLKIASLPLSLLCLCLCRRTASVCLSVNALWDKRVCLCLWHSPNRSLEIYLHRVYCFRSNRQTPSHPRLSCATSTQRLRTIFLSLYVRQ